MTIALNSSEVGLVIRAQRGDSNAFDQLTKSHYSGLFTFARKNLGNYEDAQDAVQTTFIKVHRSLSEFDTRRPFSPWLYRICANVCTDMLRRRKPAESLEDFEYCLVSELAPDEDAERKSRNNEIRKAVSRLPVRYRKIMEMRHYESLDVNEIAERLHAPEGTVKSWLYRARAMLKKELEPVLWGSLSSSNVAA